MATINGSRFTNNQTIAVNGMVGGGGQDIPSGSSGRLYVELRDPNNETVMYDSTNMTTIGNSKSPFSYRLVAGDLEANSSTTASSRPSRTVVKPMNVSGLNYTLAVGYKMPQNSPSEVQFTFAYDHGDVGLLGGLLGDEPTTVASRFAGNNTTTATTTTAEMRLKYSKTY